MTKEILHQDIINKFGTLSKFARLSGYPRYDLQKLFARKEVYDEELRVISALCSRTKDKAEDSEITPENIKHLSKALKKAGGVIKFCRDNPQFNEQSVFQILSGKRKRKTAMVWELLKHFKL